MPSSHKKLSSPEDRLYRAILARDDTAAREVLSNILGENQLAMPGFDFVSTESDVPRERRIKGIFQKIANEMQIPGKVFQMAFGRSPSLYAIVDALASKYPVDSLEKISPEVFHLVRPARALRWNDPGNAWDHYKGGDWIVQQKMDGWYVQVHVDQGKAVLLSRKGEELSWADNLRRNISEALKDENVILECELVSLTPTGAIAPRTKMKSEGNKFRAYFFDLLYRRGDWTRKPYVERLAKLQEIFLPIQDDTLRLITWRNVVDKDIFVTWFDEWINLDRLEGMIAKRPFAIYEANCRTKNFIKIKLRETVDTVVLGYTTAPRSYLFAVWDDDQNMHVPFVWITVPRDQPDIIATEIELHHQDLPKLSVGDRTTEFRIVPDFVVEVEGDTIHETDKYPCGKQQTGKGWTLFAANIKRIRNDKDVSDITTVDGFLELHSMAGQIKE